MEKNKEEDRKKSELEKRKDFSATPFGKFLRKAWEATKNAFRGVAGFFSNVTARILLGREEYAKLVREPVANAERDKMYDEKPQSHDAEKEAEKTNPNNQPNRDEVTKDEGAKDWQPQSRAEQIVTSGPEFAEYLNQRLSEQTNTKFIAIKCAPDSPAMKVSVFPKDADITNDSPTLTIQVDRNGNVTTDGTQEDTLLYANAYSGMMAERCGEERFPSEEEVSCSLKSAAEVADASTENLGCFSYHNISVDVIKNDEEQYDVYVSGTEQRYSNTYTKAQLESPESAQQVLQDIRSLVQSNGRDFIGITEACRSDEPVSVLSDNDMGDGFLSFDEIFGDGELYYQNDFATEEIDQATSDYRMDVLDDDREIE